jgi:signal transduction histidine kinase
MGHTRGCCAGSLLPPGAADDKAHMAFCGVPAGSEGAPGGPEALFASIDEFVYAVSHDLRAPLLNLQGFLRRLSGACEQLACSIEGWDLTPAQRLEWSQLSQERIQPSLEVLVRNAQRLDRLLSALLELSRAGREPAQFGLVPAGEAAGGVVEELEALAAERNATLIVEPLPHLWTDRDRLQIIFRHLLDNALKFLRPGRPGRITLGGRGGAGDAVCWVKDNGIGIKPEDQPRLFLPFGRIRQLDAPGEGIGLAIVRKLMGQLRGRVWVESVHGEGSTFFLSFPAGPGSKEA